MATLIIDCHGHYTTAPAAHDEWRRAQMAAYDDARAFPPYPHISDDQIADSLEGHQLRLQRERGTDVTLFSPRASVMEHHRGDGAVSRAWSRRCNDLIHRVVSLYPDSFFAVAQLPQSPGVPVENCVEELERCVVELGFVGLNLNPDPSGGWWRTRPLTDRSWYPLYEKMVELEVPAMIHVSASCNDNFHATGAHYLNADTTAFMQLLQGDLFSDFPDLRLVIPHGGGAVPYHWGRFRGLADMLHKPSLTQHVMGNVYFDTCCYHQAGVNLLVDVIDSGNVLFGSEMVGAVRGLDPDTGFYFDDTKRYVDAAPLTSAERAAIYSGNARRVYPRLDRALRARGQ